MNNQLADKTIAWFALLSGLAISGVAIWFSVAGLVAIFAAAAIPIIIMGTVLEVGKLVATVWLKFNWGRAPFFLKTYLLLAILVLMFITSMGIFGYLSKAHIEQSLPTGEAAAQIEIIDSRIEIQQDIIVQSRQEIEILNSQIQEYTDRGFVTRGVEARNSQREERERLLNQIASAQDQVSELREQRQPFATVIRTIEAEVGPLKYIAAMVYGNDLDQDLLESAVRWVIIIVIFVFDPLAVLLLLSSQVTFLELRREKARAVTPPPDAEPGPLREVSNKLNSDEAISKHFEQYRSVRLDNVNPPEAAAEDEQDNEEIAVNELAELANAGNVEDEAGKDLDVDRSDDPSSIVINWEQADRDLLDAAEVDERAAMLYWKSTNPGSYIVQQYILLSDGTISELPWGKYVQVDNPDPTQKKR